jgi:outer membrane protein insertion porin family
MMRSAALFYLLLALPSPPLAQCQAQRKGASVSAYKIIRIGIKGNNRYTAEQITPLLGLKVGDSAGDGDFQQAVQKLGETGLFTDVQFSYSYSQAGTEVEFQVTENNKLLPVRLENLVWFSDQEWVERLKKVIPLFQGELPAEGTLADTVADALQTMLAERGSTAARVEVRRPGEEQGAVDAIVYSVTGLPIQIKTFDFPGANRSEQDPLQAAAKRLVGEEYTRSAMRVLAQIDLAPVYLRQGKLRAEFADAQAKVLSETPQLVEVQVLQPVDEGATYKLGKLAWSGNKLIPTAKLEPMVHLKAGEPVNAIELKDDLTKVSGIYRSSGYMRAEVTPQLTLNDADSTADYMFEVSEGAQYKMGELDIAGLDEKGKARVRQGWDLREGDPYNPAYAHHFARSPEAVPAEGDWKIDIAEAVNDSDKTVDVTLTYANRAAR